MLVSTSPGTIARGGGGLLRAKCNGDDAGSLHKRAYEMKKGYDFSRAKPNPYPGRLKKQITIQVDLETIGYFRKLSDEIGIPYQTLISLYLRDCAASRKKPKMHWRSGA